MITIISRKCAHVGDELKWLFKVGVGVFSRVEIFLSKIRPPHMQLVQPYTCNGSAMPLCHTLAYA